MTEENFICINKKDKDKNDEKNKGQNLNDDNQNNNIMLWIFTLLCGLFLIVILFCFYKRLCFNKNVKDNLIESINIELIEN